MMSNDDGIDTKYYKILHLAVCTWSVLIFSFILQMLLQHVTTSTILILPIITLFSISRAVNGLCTPANCSACVMEYTPPFTVVYDASKARLDLSGQTFTMTSSDPSIISNSISKYFILQGGVLKVNNASALIRNEIALNVFGDTILPVIYHFSVFTLSPTSASFSASICVQGLDNNVPTFPRSDVHISVLEGTILSWPMDLAADNDEGENSTQSYSILSNDPSVYSDLYLDIARNRYNMITSMLLNSTAPLDPGRKASYNFTIVAQEGRPNTTKGYQNVYLTVLYFCNQPPTFEMPLYQLYLPLSTPINMSLIIVKALHLYSRTTAPISYSITSVCTTAPFTQCINYPVNSGPFALNSTSGNLTITNTVDYSQVRQFNITVVGIDACNFVGSTLVLVQITVRPLGIQVALSNKGVIREDYTLTSDVATVIVSNPDNLNINVTVLDNVTGLISDTFYLVNIGSSYRLRLLHSLDSRVKDAYNITIQASDPANSIFYYTFNITVMGVNHPPFFGTKITFINIPYNTRSSTMVLHVHALDNDVGDNGAVTYELPSPNVTYPYQNNFTVNAITGDVLVNGVLDRKVARTFLLLVRARDNPIDGEPSFSDYMVVNVTLIDAQLDFAFLNASYMFQVREQLPSGAVVGTIFTSLSNTGLVSFTILGQSDAFALNLTSGTITTKRALTAVPSLYTLHVGATYSPPDQGMPPTSIDMMVVIAVTLNLGKLQFKQSSYLTTISRSLDVGTVVLNVTIIDTTMGIMTYSVSSTSPVPFQVNSNTGSIYTTAYLDPAPRVTYTFDVEAYGLGIRSAVTVSIQVRLLIVFDQPRYDVTVPVMATKGSVVATIRAMGRRGIPVFYYFGNDAPTRLFEIDKESGNIALTGDLSSFSSYDSIDALVLGVDADDAYLNSTVDVKISAPRSLMQSTSSVPTIVIGAAGASALGLVVITVLAIAFVVSCAVRKKRTRSLAITTPDGGQPNQSSVQVRSEQVNTVAQQSEGDAPVVMKVEQVNPWEFIYADSHQRNASGGKAPSPSKSKPLSAIRSTSDLASTIGTDMLTDMEDKEPYTSEQLAAIYAANAQLLRDGGSQDSVHMFGSEGGFEVDEVDIDRSYFDDDAENYDSDSSQNRSSRSVHDSGLTPPRLDQSSAEFKGVPVIVYSNSESPNLGCFNPLQLTAKHGSQPILAKPRPYFDISCAPHSQYPHSYNACDSPCKARFSSALAVDRLHSHTLTSTPLHNHKTANNRGGMSFSQEQFVPRRAMKLGISNCMRYSQGLPPHLTISHNDIHLDTPPSASPTDDGIVSSITTEQRVPERYLSNSSLGSTHLS